MVNLGIHLVNSKGQKAHIGDEVKLTLNVPSVITKDWTYRITNIRQDGSVMFYNCVWQNICEIDDFRIVSRQRR